MAVVMRHKIAARTGTAFTLDAGEHLAVIDPRGGQVADLLAFNRSDIGEMLSNGRTLDYANKIYLTTGDTLYSNRSRPLLEIVADDVGRHDFLLTPCSKDTFRIIYGEADPHQGCFGNLSESLAPYGVTEDMIPTAFNCFMNVPVNGETGEFKVLPPLSKAGDKVVFKARIDLVIGLTACSALQSNGGSFKPIEYELSAIPENCPSIQ